MTVERHAPAGEKRPSEGTIIPFPGMGPLLRHVPVALVPGSTSAAWTLRPRDVVLLLPLIIPATVLILLGLLGWFVCWLVTVTLLTVSIVVADMARSVLWRLSPPAVRALDRQAVS